ncbi:FG-GAP repeat [Carpediemonas membranifera]|uniref:FG-GAP repeat n=1 Tax=Carpediemonas membranifera TaxID=201153 RepID=A0A8J6AUI6_9EUKA|nr:FG-GAP repeat [Carpediemonas membranifera]|eukprot:KAG9394513.1 FG-GAP repeat [Carpediemonas membranifera]
MLFLPTIALFSLPRMQLAKFPYTPVDLTTFGPYPTASLLVAPISESILRLPNHSSSLFVTSILSLTQSDVGHDSHGRVYIYDRKGTSFSESLTILDPPDLSSQGIALHSFGSALAIEGDVLAVGASTSTNISTGGYCGTMAVFAKSSYSWVLTGTMSSDPDTATLSNGLHIAISGGLVYTRWYADYLYSIRVLDTQCNIVTTICPPTSNDMSSLAAADGWLVVGTADNYGHEAAYMYNITTPASPTLVSTIEGPCTGEWKPKCHFGRAVSVRGDTVAVGAPNYLYPVDQAGAAFIYQFNSESSQFEQVYSTRGYSAEQNYGQHVAVAESTLFFAGQSTTSNFVIDLDACDPGTYLSMTGECVPCLLGHYQPDQGQFACLDPDAGRYVPPFDRSSQVACPAGYSPNEGNWTCVNDTTSSPFTLNAAQGGLNHTHVRGVALSSSMIATVSYNETYALALFDMAGNFLSKTQLTVNPLYASNVAMTDGHIIVTAWYKGGGEHTGVGTITAFSHASTPVQIKTFTYESFYYMSGELDEVSEDFGLYQPAAYQINGSASVFVVGDDSGSCDGKIQNGRVYIVTAAGLDADNVKAEVIKGKESYNSVGRAVAVDENYVFAAALYSIEIFSHSGEPVHTITHVDKLASLSSDGLILAAGRATLENPDVYIYNLATFTKAAVITPSRLSPDGTTNVRATYTFGSALALCGDFLVVSEYNANVQFDEDGYIYMYQITEDGFTLISSAFGNAGWARLGQYSIACNADIVVAGMDQVPASHDEYCIAASVFGIPQCMPGHEGPTCTPCGPGSYAPLGDSMCLDASVDYFTNTTGAQFEEACAAGYFQPAVGQTSCIRNDTLVCDNGTYLPTDSSACIPAPAGYYVPADHQPHSIPIPCNNGSYSDTTGLATCKRCVGHDQWSGVEGPQTGCTAFINDNVVIRNETGIAFKRDHMPSGVKDATLGSWQCRMTGNDTMTIAVPVVTPGESIGGVYTLTFGLDNGKTSTTTVTIPDDFTMPQPTLSLTGTSMRSVIDSPICPSVLDMTGFDPVALDSVGLGDDGEVECRATKAVSAGTLHDYFSPAVDAVSPKSGSQACISLSGASFGSLADLSVLYDGTTQSTRLVDCKLCFTIPASADSTSYEQHTVVACLDGTPFLSTTLSIEVDPADSSDSSAPVVIAVVLGVGAVLVVMLAVVAIAVIGLCLVVAMIAGVALVVMRSLGSKGGDHDVAYPMAGEHSNPLYGVQA